MGAATISHTSPFPSRIPTISHNIPHNIPTYPPGIHTPFVSLSHHELNPLAPVFYSQHPQPYPQFQQPPHSISTKPSARNLHKTDNPKHPHKAKKQPQPTSTAASKNTQQKEPLCINNNNEDWQQRLQKRSSIIASIQWSYQAVLAQREGSHQAALRTPSPDGHSVSKRQWEKKVMKWRNALKNKELNGLATKANASAQVKLQHVSSLCHLYRTH